MRAERGANRVDRVSTRLLPSTRSVTHVFVATEGLQGLQAARGGKGDVRGTEGEKSLVKMPTRLGANSERSNHLDGILLQQRETAIHDQP